MDENDFQSSSWSLFEAMDGLMAYYHGATDSGIKDDKLKEDVKAFLLKLDSKNFRYIVSRYARKYLTDEMLACGYGLENVIEFIRWLEDELEIDIR